MCNTIQWNLTQTYIFGLPHLLLVCCVILAYLNQLNDNKHGTKEEQVCYISRKKLYLDIREQRHQSSENRRNAIILREMSIMGIMMMRKEMMVIHCNHMHSTNQDKLTTIRIRIVIKSFALESESVVAFCNRKWISKQWWVGEIKSFTCSVIWLAIMIVTVTVFYVNR